MWRGGNYNRFRGRKRWTAPVLPLKAADFMKSGVAKGPALDAIADQAAA
jgi:hypothetical protein